MQDRLLLAVRESGSFSGHEWTVTCRRRRGRGPLQNIRHLMIGVDLRLTAAHHAKTARREENHARLSVDDDCGKPGNGHTAVGSCHPDRRYSLSGGLGRGDRRQSDRAGWEHLHVRWHTGRGQHSCWNRRDTEGEGSGHQREYPSRRRTIGEGGSPGRCSLICGGQHPDQGGRHHSYRPRRHQGGPAIRGKSRPGRRNPQ
jgi:hypothetical protein